MIFIDSHTHLYLEDFDTDIDAVVENAIHHHVHYMLLPHIDSRSTTRLLGLSKKYPENCFPMMGLHPTSVKENYKDELAWVEDHLASGKYCAVGEIGIDLYWDTTFFNQQVDALRFQLDLALAYGLPVAIHSRKSLDEILDILEDYRDIGLKGVFHCFPGNLEEAEKVIDLGFLLGIGGVLTYKNSGLDKVVEAIDLKHIILETDAPFLTPVPKRGMRNESAFIPYIAQKIADIKGISLEEVARITTQNAITLFNLNTITL